MFCERVNVLNRHETVMCKCKCMRADGFCLRMRVYNVLWWLLICYCFMELNITTSYEMQSIHIRHLLRSIGRSCLTQDLYVVWQNSSVSFLTHQLETRYRSNSHTCSYMCTNKWTHCVRTVLEYTIKTEHSNTNVFILLMFMCMYNTHGHIHTHIYVSVQRIVSLSVTFSVKSY